MNSIEQKILSPEPEKEKREKESFLNTLDNLDWQTKLKPALERNDYQTIQELHKEYLKQYPEDQEGIETFFNVLSAWSKEKQLKDSSLKGNERKDAIRELTEYQFLLTHFLIENSKNKERLEKFWKILEETASVSENTEEFQKMKQGVLGQVAIFLAFDKLNLHPRLAHPSLDMFNQIDLQAEDTNLKEEIDFQIKTSKGASSAVIFSSSKVYFPSVEVNQKDNTVINVANKHFALKNLEFQMHLKEYQEMIKKQVKGYLVVLPYQEIDSITGQPSQELVDFMKEKLVFKK